MGPAGRQAMLQVAGTQLPRPGDHLGHGLNEATPQGAPGQQHQPGGEDDGDRQEHRGEPRPAAHGALQGSVLFGGEAREGRERRFEVSDHTLFVGRFEDLEPHHAVDHVGIGEDVVHVVLDDAVGALHVLDGEGFGREAV